MKRVISLIIGVFGALLSLSSALFLIRFAIAFYEISSKNDNSIGIIGGADAPTTVFIASSGVAIPLLIAIAGLITGIICVIVSAVLLRKKKSE